MGRLLSRHRGETTGGVTVALLLTAICWYLGTNVWYSILIGSTLTTVGLLVLIAGSDPELGNLDPRTPSSAKRHGARRDVAELSSSLRGSYGRVGGRSVWRLQQLARRRLEPYQLNLQNPDDRRQIEALIGRRAYAVLDRGVRRPPWLRTYVHCLEALEALRAPYEG